MATVETSVILDQIQSMVSDKLQVVSYKWLSRHFLVSSNAAKRLLDEFDEKYGNGLEVIYSLSGWLKSKPSNYHIQLAPRHKLSDAKQEFDGNCSIHVYSVQACLPKDPALLWNHEFAQSEFLFKQKSSVDNCLWDNRFCGVSNSYVHRDGGETHIGSGTLQLKTTGSSYGSMVDQPLLQTAVLRTCSETGLRIPDGSATVKTEKDQEKAAQHVVGKGKVEQLPLRKTNGQRNKSSAGTSALAGIWGRASTKSKSDALLQQAHVSGKNSTASAEAQICARESVDLESSDEESRDFNVKRTSVNEGARKRRAVFDYSDEEDDHKDAVALASPDTKQIPLSSEQSSKDSDLESNLNFDVNENKHEVKEVMETETTNKYFEEKLPDIAKEMPQRTLTSVQAAASVPKVPDTGSKRRKVLSRIDERGREVTEVVWEGEEPETKSNTISPKMFESNATNNSSSRPPVARKPAASVNSAPTNPGGKAGNKKASAKDPKQGNILSFFKKLSLRIGNRDELQNGHTSFINAKR